MATPTSSVVPAAMGPRRVCNVCCHAVAAYTCPRCHKAYCSSACYKQHGQQCTEAFYRDQATSQLKATRADHSQQQHMLRILQRLHEQDIGTQLESDAAGSRSDESSEEDEAAALVAAGVEPELARSAEFQQLLQRADVEGNSFDIAPSQLSPELAAKLGALIVSGRLSHLVAPWQPWWLSKAAAQLTLGPSGQRVVMEVKPSQEPSAAAAAALTATAGASAENGGGGSNVDDQDSSAALPPPPDRPLPSLAELAGPRFTPSPLLPWQLLQLLVAYCAVLRRWNGEPDCRSSSSSSEGWEAAEQLLLLAPPLVHLVPGPTAVVSKPVQAAERQQEQQQSEPMQVMPESVRVAHMQLAAAATALAQQQGMPPDTAINDAVSLAVPGAVPSDVVGLLAVATADALALLRLGRSAVLLALTDSWRLLEQSRRLVKPSQQQARSIRKQLDSSEQQQGQQKEPPCSTANSSGAAHTGSSSRSRLLQLQQHMKLAARKLHFFMVWCNQQPAAMHAQLAHAVDCELQEQQAISQPVQRDVMFRVQELCTPAATACLAQGPSVALGTSCTKPLVAQLETNKQEWQCMQSCVANQQQQREMVCKAMPSHAQQVMPHAPLLQKQPQQQGTLEGPANRMQVGVSEQSLLPPLQQHGQLDRPQLTEEVTVKFTNLYDLD